MDHTGNLSFVFGFHRDTVAAVSHGDDAVLKVIAGAAVYQGGKLCVDAVVGCFHGAAHVHQSTAGIVADLILGKDTAADLRGKRGERFQTLEHAVQGVLFCIATLVSGVGFYPVGIFKKSGNGKKFGDPKGTSDFQAF